MALMGEWANRGWEQLLQQAKRLQAKYYSKESSSLESYTPPLAFPSNGSIRDLLVFKPDEIGDAIQALPALRHLRENFPNSRIHMICQKPASEIYRRSGVVDEIAASSVKKIQLRFPRLDLRDALDQLKVSRFDASVFLRTYPSYFSQFLKIPATFQVHPRDPRMPSRSLYQAKVGIWKSPRDHQSKQMMEIVSYMTGKTPENFEYGSFHWDSQDKEALEDLGQRLTKQKYFVVHPFARIETRAYPSWNELIEKVQKQFSLPVVIIGGQEDETLQNDKVIQLQGKLTLGQSAYLISQSAGFLGNESGPAHWAAAMGVPTVTVFGGHSHPNEWRPVGAKTHLVHESVACGPCHRHYCPGLGRICLTGLSPDKIWPEMQRFLLANQVRSCRGPSGEIRESEVRPSL